MRKHRLFGVVLAVLLGAGVLTQRPSNPHPAAGNGFDRSGFQLTSAQSSMRAHQAAAFHAVRTQGFMIRPATAPATDTLIELSAFMKPLPPITPPPPPLPVAPRAAPVTAPSSGDVWAALRNCESSGNYADDTGNGYYGAYQFSEATWRSLGLSGLPSQAPPDVQDQAAHELQARSGWGQWPVCSRRFGL